MCTIFFLIYKLGNNVADWGILQNNSCCMFTCTRKCTTGRRCSQLWRRRRKQRQCRRIWKSIIFFFQIFFLSMYPSNHFSSTFAVEELWSFKLKGEQTSRLPLRQLRALHRRTNWRCSHSRRRRGIAENEFFYLISSNDTQTMEVKQSGGWMKCVYQK